MIDRLKVLGITVAGLMALAVAGALGHAAIQHLGNAINEAPVELTASGWTLIGTILFALLPLCIAGAVFLHWRQFDPRGMADLFIPWRWRAGYFDVIQTQSVFRRYSRAARRLGVHYDNPTRVALADDINRTIARWAKSGEYSEEELTSLQERLDSETIMLSLRML